MVSAMIGGVSKSNAAVCTLFREQPRVGTLSRCADCIRAAAEVDRQTRQASESSRSRRASEAGRVLGRQLEAPVTRHEDCQHATRLADRKQVQTAKHTFGREVRALTNRPKRR